MGPIPQTVSRWPAWLNAAALLFASWLLIAVLSFQARPGAEVIAVAFPPLWNSQQVFAALASSDAAIVRITALATVVVVRPSDRDGLVRLRRGLALPRSASRRGVFGRDFQGHFDVMDRNLESFREAASRALIALLWLHVPIAAAIGMARGTGGLLPTLFMMLLAGAAKLSWRVAGNGVSTRLVVAVALMSEVAMLTFQLSGHPWQSDLHMYFFAMLACLVAYCDFRPIMAAAIAVSLHHLALNFLVPAAIYPGGSDLGRVLLHAAVLAMEAGVLIWLVRQLHGLIATAQYKTAEALAANAGEALANVGRAEAERRAQFESEAATAAKAATRAKSEFLAMMSHEIRTP